MGADFGRGEGSMLIARVSLEREILCGFATEDSGMSKISMTSDCFEVIWTSFGSADCKISWI